MYTVIHAKIANCLPICCTGLPDLFLWNDYSIKFVEVKGPGDTLSDRQRAWIDQLLRSGANVDVCHVKHQAISE